MNTELKNKLIDRLKQWCEDKGNPPEEVKMPIFAATINGWQPNLITATMYAAMLEMYPDDKSIQFLEPPEVYLGKTKQREDPDDPKKTITWAVVDPVFKQIMVKAEIDRLDLEFKGVKLKNADGILVKHEKLYASSLGELNVAMSTVIELIENNLVT